jgi:formylglycine-generating enzyme required for sulfatase activity
MAKKKSTFKSILPNIETVKVRGGKFLFGPQRNKMTQVEDFEMGKFLITQKQWLDVMGENPSHFKNVENWENHPVENVSWNDVQAFITKLNELDDKYTYALPTEEEWEYAARGGHDMKDFKYAGSNNLDEVGWYYSNSNGKTHPVGQKLPNSIGLYDMSGNVWEWTSSVYGPVQGNVTNPNFIKYYKDKNIPESITENSPIPTV